MIFECNYCGQKLESELFSSDIFSILRKNNWKYEICVESKFVPTKISHDQYKGTKKYKNHYKSENKLIVICDKCQLLLERKNKLLKILGKK